VGQMPFGWLFLTDNHLSDRTWAAFVDPQLLEDT
jgi:hypothetical protein